MEDESFRLELPLAELSTQTSVDYLKQRYSLPADDSGQKVRIDKQPIQDLIP